ncbi:MAG: alpha/beta fold hydrolase [Candidatus Acidiferrales bacterium]
MLGSANMCRRLSIFLLIAWGFTVGGAAQPVHCQNSTVTLGTAGEYLNLSGSRIYYEQCGSGPAVVLLHDGLLHSNTWDRVWPGLCQKYHMVRYDRRGYGKSDPAKTRYSPVEDLFALLGHLNVQRAIIVGNSSGGALAIDFALAHPQMVEGLFLVGPVVQGMDTSPQFNERARKAMAPLARGDLKGAAEKWSKDQYIVAGTDVEARKIIYHSLVENPQDLTHSNELEIPNAKPSVYRLSEIHAPTSILVGEFDIPDVHAESGAIEVGIQSSQRDILNGAGHLIQLEAPAAFIERLSRFVDLQQRKGMELPAAVLQSYVGEYDAGPFVITIALEDGHLVLQTAGVQPFPLFAESKSKFFMKVWRLEIEFSADSTGKVSQATIYEDGSSFKASRL